MLSCVFLLMLGAAIAQQIGTQLAESHPSLTSQTCTKAGGCKSQSTSIVLDSNWRWVHNVGGYDNCYTGDEWSSAHCPDPVTCAKNCALDGADYTGTYGIRAQGSTLDITLVTHGQYGNNIGSRVYLLANTTSYQQFYLKNREFTFDVDVSNLPCGLNGALYFVEMPADGGVSKYANNKAGAQYGTGYCDAQCPHDMKFINGEANILDWKISPNDPNSGTGRYGTCCIEMDIWEANSMASAYTPHVCTVQGQYRCNGTECGDGDERYGGVCDKDGCDFNSFRMGNKGFFGTEGTGVNTKQPFTVVTQFITSDGTDNGALSEIRRIYVQNGKVVPNSAVNIPGMKAYTSVSDDFCKDQKAITGDKNDFAAKGGLKTMQGALERGMTLVMSLWDDYAAYMLWLDSNYPVDADPSKAGIARGACATSSGRPKDVESQYPNANVKFMNVRSGQIGSTYAS